MKQGRNEKAYQKNEEHKIINGRPEIQALTMFSFILNSQPLQSLFLSASMSRVHSNVSYQFLPTPKCFSAAPALPHTLPHTSLSHRGSLGESARTDLPPPAFVLAGPSQRNVKTGDGAGRDTPNLARGAKGLFVVWPDSVRTCIL